jgi:hypothetical protein
MAAHNAGLLTKYGVKIHEKKCTHKNLGQDRYCLTINGIFNNPEPLQSSGCQIK